MKNFFDGKKKVIGMVHLLALPANAAYKDNKDEIVKFALEDAKTLIDCGVDAIMLENFNDWPQYADETPMESYTLIPFGVNVEMNAWQQEWIMAWAVNADFIRLEAFVDNRGGSFGYIPACSTPLSKVMKDYPADVMLFTDVMGEGSQFIFYGPLSYIMKDVVETVFDDHSGFDPKIISRKQQLMPKLSELIKNL